MRQSGSGTGTGDGGAVTVRTPGVGGGGELDTLQIYLDVLYIISLYHYNNLKLHSQFICIVLWNYCFIVLLLSQCEDEFFVFDDVFFMGRFK